MDETKLLENINNLICVFKINLNRIGLERHEGEENNDNFHLQINHTFREKMHHVP